MDIANLILASFVALITIATFWMAVYKIMAKKYDVLDSKIEDRYDEAIKKIDEIKENYVHSSVLKIHTESISKTQQEIKSAIAQLTKNAHDESREAREQYGNILALLTRSRRDEKD